MNPVLVGQVCSGSRLAYLLAAGKLGWAELADFIPCNDSRVIMIRYVVPTKFPKQLDSYRKQTHAQPAVWRQCWDNSYYVIQQKQL